jgi:diaminopimelate decarboxylase
MPRDLTDPQESLDAMPSPLDLLSRVIVSRSRRNQAIDGIPDLGLWGLENDNGQLRIDGVHATRLIEQFGSPLLVVNETRLRRDIDDLSSAFFAQAPEGSKIVYSYKTNFTPGILRVIHECGIGAEVISPFELWLANELSIDGANTVYNGTSKTEASLREAIERQILSINVDSLKELQLLQQLSADMGRKAPVGLRLGLVHNTQFGLDVAAGETFEAAREIARHPDHFDWRAVHIHTVANCQHSRDHLHYVMKALEFLRAVKEELGLEVPYLDIGGGLGVPTVSVMSRLEYAWYRLFGTLPRRPDPAASEPVQHYVENVVGAIKGYCEQHGLPLPRLIMEPGRVVVSRGEILLTRVNDIKPKTMGPTFALTDVGKHSVTYPCDYEFHEILVANKLDRELRDLYQIVGRICTSADTLVKNKCLPTLESGDVLAILDAGAYFSSYSSNFAFPRPAIVKVRDGECELLQSEETFDHIVAMDALR